MPAPRPAQPAQSVEHYLGVLRRVSAYLTANAARDGVLAALADGLRPELEPDRVEVWRYSPADGDLRLLFQDQVDGAAPGKHVTPGLAAAHPVARAARLDAPLVIEDVYREEAPPDLDRFASLGLRAYAAVPLRSGGRLWGVLAVARPEPFPTALVEVLRALGGQAALLLDHARLLEESRILQTLAAELASARDPHILLDRLVARMTGAVGADACAVWVFGDGERLSPRASYGFSATFFDRVARYTAPPGAFAGLTRDQSPLHFPDLPAVIRRRDPEAAAAYADEGVVSSLLLLLFSPDEQLAGLLVLYHRHERHYSPDEVGLAQAFADQVSIALHNARLAEQERQAREAASFEVARLAALRRITRELLAATDLTAVLEVVAEAAWRLSNTHGGSLVALISPDRNWLHFAAYRGPIEAVAREGITGTALDDAYRSLAATGQAIARNETVIVEDYRTWPPARYRDSAVAGGIIAMVIAPLRVDGVPIGVLIVNDSAPRRFSADEVATIEALAEQAALAIEHARLVEHSRETAALHERTRLARDLHDSVTQSVFSIGLMANAALGQHERGLPAAGDMLRRIKSVAQDALGEMRALLFELHPPALADEGLVTALRRLVEMVQIRVDIPITFSGELSQRLAPDTETAIFRIVQEALSNAAKYAQATALSVTVSEEHGRLRVAVRDNGVGFDPLAPVTASVDGKRGGMGLGSMRARAAAAGLTLEISSAPGAGASVVVTALLA